jgi:hypothetical protein
LRNLIKLNVEQLTHHYQMTSRQTAQSFRLAAAAGATGFVFILAGMVVSGLNSQDYLKSTAPGLIVEFIAGVFLALFNHARGQMLNYHATLVGAQKVLMALSLADKLEGSDKNNAVIQIITALAKADTSPPTATHA